MPVLKDVLQTESDLGEHLQAVSLEDGRSPTIQNPGLQAVWILKLGFEVEALGKLLPGGEDVEIVTAGRRQTQELVEACELVEREPLVRVHLDFAHLEVGDLDAEALREPRDLLFDGLAVEDVVRKIERELHTEGPQGVLPREYDPLQPTLVHSQLQAAVAGPNRHSGQLVAGALEVALDPALDQARQLGAHDVEVVEGSHRSVGVVGEHLVAVDEELGPGRRSPRRQQQEGEEDGPHPRSRRSPTIQAPCCHLLRSSRAWDRSAGTSMI